MLKITRVFTVLSAAVFSVSGIFCFDCNISWAKGRGRSGGSVRVRGYYQNDGTYVRPHTRSAPGYGGTSTVTPSTPSFEAPLTTPVILDSTPVPNTTKNERWLTIGKSNSGNILSLDINSVQAKPHANNWLWFSYRVTNDQETREYIARTGSCIQGEISNESEWIIDTTNVNGDFVSPIEIKTDSPGSQALLKKVCQTGGIKPVSQTSATQSSALSLISAQPQARNIVIVAGITNNGNRLSFAPSSVKVQTKTDTAGDYNRFFNYSVLRKDGSQAIHIDAHTPWCNKGKIELDTRAIDNQVFYLTKIYNNIDIMTTPGWFIDSGYVVADSTASRNLLKEVCLATAEPKM